jgi:hypothetical protein
MTGKAWRITSATCLRKTSPSSRNVVVSDQLRTEALMVRPPFEKLSDSTVVKGHGPAMQDNLAFRNSFPSPASSVAEPTAAFHLIPGEQGGFPAQGRFPVFMTSKVLTALPMLTAFVVSIE